MAPSVQAVGAIDSQVANLRLTILAHMLTTDAANKSSLDKQIVDERNKLGEMRKHYETLINSPQEKALYEEFAAGWTQYVEVNNRALELSRNSDNA